MHAWEKGEWNLDRPTLVKMIKWMHTYSNYSFILASVRAKKCFLIAREQLEMVLEVPCFLGEAVKLCAVEYQRLQRTRWLSFCSSVSSSLGMRIGCKSDRSYNWWCFYDYWPQGSQIQSRAPIPNSLHGVCLKSYWDIYLLI